MGIEISPRLAEYRRQRMPADKILEGPVTEVADTTRWLKNRSMW